MFEGDDAAALGDEGGDSKMGCGTAKRGEGAFGDDAIGAQDGVCDGHSCGGCAAAIMTQLQAKEAMIGQRVDFAQQGIEITFRLTLGHVPTSCARKIEWDCDSGPWSASPLPCLRCLTP